MAMWLLAPAKNNEQVAFLVYLINILRAIKHSCACCGDLHMQRGRVTLALSRLNLTPAAILSRRQRLGFFYIYSQDRSPIRHNILLVNGNGEVERVVLHLEK